MKTVQNLKFVLVAKKYSHLFSGAEGPAIIVLEYFFSNNFSSRSFYASRKKTLVWLFSGTAKIFRFSFMKIFSIRIFSASRENFCDWSSENFGWEGKNFG